MSDKSRVSRTNTNLHRALIDEQSIEFLVSLVRHSRLVEYNSSYTAADAIGPVLQRNSLRSSNGLGKIFLKWEDPSVSQILHGSVINI